MDVFYTELRKSGDSLVLTVPFRLVKGNNWKENTPVKVGIKQITLDMQKED